MTISFSLVLLLLTLTTAAAAAAAAHHHHHPIFPDKTHPHSVHTTHHRRRHHHHHHHHHPHKPTSTTYKTHPLFPQTPAAEIQETHLDNIIDALIGAGDFVGWANLLSTADPSSLPLTATFFIPGNDAVSNLSAAAEASVPFDGFLIAYHIVPQRLTFSDLQKLVTRTRLPTLLPAKYIVITNNSPANFTVDGSQITHPDIFVSSAFSVQGVRKLLDYSVYGGGRVPSPPMPENKKSPRVSAPGQRQNPASPGEVNVISGVSTLFSSVLMIYQVSCAVLGI